MARRKNGQAADGSVTIDLSKPPSAEDKFEPDLPDYGSKPAESSAAEPKVETVTPVAPAPPPIQPQDNDLESQIKAMKARQQAAEQRAQQAEHARLAEQQRAQQALQQYQSRAEQGEYDSVANALIARQNEEQILKSQLLDAKQRGDAQAEVDIIDKMTAIKIEVQQLQSGKADFERQFQQRQNQPPPPPQQYQQPSTPQQVADWVIAQRNDWRPGEVDWIREHPDAVADPGQFQQLQAAAAYAAKRGIERGTPEYFQLVNDRLGYEADEPQYDEVDMVDEPRHNPRPLPAAPPSRPSPGLSVREAPSGTRVTLSPAEREAAKISKISEHEYARNKARLVDMKRRGFYQERG